MRALLACSLLLCACGARSELGAPRRDAGVDAATLDATAERSCPFDCTIGHQCCAGSCSGPAVPMPSDCCACLPGEVSSFTCGNGDRCGQ